MFDKKFLAITFVLILVSYSFPAKAAGNNTYIFVLIARGNPFWTSMAAGIEDESSKKGIKSSIFYTESSTSAEEQLNICQTAIQSHPNAITMVAINPSVAIQCFKQAQALGIPVADIDAALPVVDAEKAGINLAYSIGSDNYLIGQKGAEYVAGIAGKPNPKVFVLEGTVGSVQARKRTDGFRDKLKELLPQAEIVASITAEFDRLKAMNITLDMLQRQPDLDIIYAANDEMALGAAEASRNLGRDKHLQIIGVDGTADGRKAILNGKMTATIAQLPYLMGKRSVDLILDSIVTHKTGVSEVTETPVLTKKLLEENKDPFFNMFGNCTELSMKRIILAGLLLLFSIQTAHADDKYVFILKAIGNAYWLSLKQGIEDTSAKAAIHPILMYPVNDLAKEEDLNLCQAAIAQKPKIIVMGAETTAIAIQCYKQAQAQGILVADMDATISVELAIKSGINLQYTIGADNTLIGEKVAEFVADQLKGKNDAPKILILEGAVGSPPGQDRPNGFKIRIAQLMPNSQIVNSVAADWDRLRAMNITNDTLTRTPDLNVIFAANDVMALGAVEAVRSAGKQSQVMIIGVDGIADARKAISDGLMTASITQLPYFIGKRTAELAFYAAQGKKFEPTERAPLLILTRDILKDGKDPLLQYVR